ncbi:hypothetical protein RIR_jg24621.t1 [Rhizophagus irregularis DAOM 181602=DAOM 197198]|nr:hypothetical protein RIR_jg24621.t1 [Rhizophagus irregularis DAOM 181602=DAOM 197198]
MLNFRNMKIMKLGMVKRTFLQKHQRTSSSIDSTDNSGLFVHNYTGFTTKFRRKLDVHDPDKSGNLKFQNLDIHYLGTKYPHESKNFN